MSFVPREPDYILKFKHKTIQQSGRIGAAWLNENGPDEQLTLFPRDKKEAQP
jgi:hypothetical protein